MVHPVGEELVIGKPASTRKCAPALAGSFANGELRAHLTEALGRLSL